MNTVRPFRFLISGMLALLLSACGTTAKVQERGDISVADDRAPVLLQYDFKIPSDRHELFFWDEDKNRFNVKVESGTDTGTGIVIYLPAGRKYALSGFLTVKPIGTTEYPLGEYLDTFEVKRGVVTALPYFEIAPGPGDTFRVR